MRYVLRSIGGPVACAAALIACAGSAEEPAERQSGPLAVPIPAAVAGDPTAVELARVWVARERLQVALRADAIDHPVQWGAILAEVARHIANSSVESRGADRTEILDGIVLGFQAGLSHTPEGLEGGVAP